MEKGPHVPVMAVRDPAIKRNFKCKVCQSALELGNMGKGQWLRGRSARKPNSFIYGLISPRF